MMITIMSDRCTLLSPTCLYFTFILSSSKNIQNTLNLYLVILRANPDQHVIPVCVLFANKAVNLL